MKDETRCIYIYRYVYADERNIEFMYRLLVSMKYNSLRSFCTVFRMEQRQGCYRQVGYCYLLSMVSDDISKTSFFLKSIHGPTVGKGRGG